MTSIYHFKFVYANGKEIVFNGNKKFPDAVRLALNGGLSEIGTPLKIAFPAGFISQFMYFDDDLCRNYIQDNLSLDELVHRCLCDALSRNTRDYTFRGKVIPAGSLFMRKGLSYQLVDADDFIEIDMRHHDNATEEEDIFVDI